MIFRRLMMLPKFCFSEAVQSVEGTPAITQATSHPPSPILPLVDTLGLFSVLLPEATPCNQSRMILLTSAMC